MAIKKILTMTQTPERGKPVVVLQGGTYDTESGQIDPGTSRWLGSLFTDDRDYSWELEFADGTRQGVELSSFQLQGSSTIVVARRDR